MDEKETYGLRLKALVIDLITDWQSQGKEVITINEITGYFIVRLKRNQSFRDKENLKRRIKIAVRNYAAIGKIKTSYQISSDHVTELIVVKK
jgi:hypothetical protein